VPLLPPADQERAAGQLAADLYLPERDSREKSFGAGQLGRQPASEPFALSLGDFQRRPGGQFVRRRKASGAAARTSFTSAT